MKKYNRKSKTYKKYKKRRKVKNPSSISKDLLDVGMYLALIGTIIYGVFYLGK